MINDFNTLFQKSWFGPFPAPGVPVGAEERPLRRGRVYDQGPLDGLKTASMWAWQMSALPPVNRGLGHARLSQAPCPPGQVGYMAKDGLKCTAAPSGMIGQYGQAPVPNRRTFEVGPWWGQKGGLGQASRLGQGVETMTHPDRENMLAAINAAMEKVPELEDLVAYSGDYDPNLARTLGMDSSRFFALSNSIAPLYQTVKTVQDRLYDPEPAMWTLPTAAEFAAVKQWVTGITEMYRIYTAHKNMPLQVPEDVKAPPGFTNVNRPSTPTVVTRTTPGATAPAGESPFSTKNLLIGGSVVAGVGLLAYVLFS